MHSPFVLHIGDIPVQERPHLKRLSASTVNIAWQPNPVLSHSFTITSAYGMAEGPFAIPQA